MSALRVPLPARLLSAQIESGRADTKHLPQTDPDLLTEALVGSGQLMQGVFRRIAFVAPTRAAVLVVGEAGTEVEAAARAIHAHSTRNHGPFVTFHTADRTPDDIEATLFSSATEPERGGGLLIGAAGGTLFLGEVTGFTLPVQAKLLDVIDRREVVPVGEFVSRPADVRLIATTANPAVAIRTGRLRQDFADRLGVYPIVLPPLRDRIEDVPAARWLALSRATVRKMIRTNAK